MTDAQQVLRMRSVAYEHATAGQHINVVIIHPKSVRCVPGQYSGRRNLMYICRTDFVRSVQLMIGKLLREFFY